MKYRVAIYTRLSDEDRNKKDKNDYSNSIKNQISMLTKEAERQDWEIYDIYNDDDYRGTDRNRPEFNRLLNDAEAGNFDIVLCKTQSRFTRELEMVEQIIHFKFPLWGIRFKSIVDNADTDVKGNKKSRQINGLVNEWYLEDNSENIKEVFNNLMERGYYIGSTPLYGYIKDPHQKGHLIIDEEAAKIIREVFNLYASGYGKTKIAKILNGRGIPNPTEYKRLKGISYKTPSHKSGKLWKYHAINDMLRNEMYIGNMVQGRYGSESYKTKKNRPKPKEKWIIVRNTHEAIIPMSLWDTVQKKINANYKPFHDTGKVGLFAKKVRCMNCGYFLKSHKNQQKRMLLCPTRQADISACTGAYITVKKLEEKVLQEFNGMVEQYLDLNLCEEKLSISNKVLEQKQLLMDEKKRCLDLLEENSLVQKNLYIDKVKNNITEENFQLLSDQFSKDKERYADLLQNVNHKLDAIGDIKKEEINKTKIIKKYANMEVLTREAVEYLIDYIVVSETIPGTRDHHIEIHWNF